MRFGNVTVPVYRTRRPDGQWRYEVAYTDCQGKRRKEGFSLPQAALDRAEALARRLSERGVAAASLSPQQAAEYVEAQQTLPPGVSVLEACRTVAACLEHLPELSAVLAAAQDYAARHQTLRPKPLPEVVEEFLALKADRRLSARHLQDLRARLRRFAKAFRTDTHRITTAHVATWLDAQKLHPQNYVNYRRVLFGLFRFAVSRGYALDNPVAAVEKPKVPPPPVHIYSPAELARLLAAAPPDYLPCLGIGALAGLRSAEITRLDWAEVRLDRREIVVGAHKAKTATRRIVPMYDALVAWLAPYAGRAGKVWAGTPDAHYITQRETARRAGLDWKPNALRHSYASYRFALLRDAGRVAGELGNSAAVVHRHYRELVSEADAQQWFSLRPQAPANVVPLAHAAP